MLFSASIKGDVGKLRKFKEAGADLNAADYDRRNAGHIAAANNQLEVVQFLLEGAFDFREKDVFGQMPLDESRKRGYEEISRALEGIAS